MWTRHSYTLMPTACEGLGCVLCAAVVGCCGWAAALVGTWHACDSINSPQTLTAAALQWWLRYLAWGTVNWALVTGRVQLNSTQPRPSHETRQPSCCSCMQTACVRGARLPAVPQRCGGLLLTPCCAMLCHAVLQVMPQLLSFMDIDAEDPQAPDW